jgi:protein-S-isoprenylcysteine O-methyltransferase Ste14
MQYVLSICLLFILIIMVQIRAAIMRKRGIRIMLFGKADKSDFLLMPLVLAIVYTALANTFGLPMWNVLIHPFWNSTAPGWAGLSLCAIAVVGFALTLASFGDSFRVGIDENTKDKLITTGMFRVSRNPIYVCFLIFFTGLLLIHRNIVIAVAYILLALAIHRQILREEKFLGSHYGEEYEEYRSKVRRYL